MKLSERSKRHRHSSIIFSSPFFSLSRSQSLPILAISLVYYSSGNLLTRTDFSQLFILDISCAVIFKYL